MPNLTNPNLTGLHASNDSKRKAAETAILLALRVAGKRGLTHRDLVQNSGISDVTVRKQMPGLRSHNFLHIGAWEIHGKHLVPSYVYGPGRDAKHDDYLHLRSELCVDVESEARKEIEREHEKWARDWKPHRPVEAAWI